jgi:DnaD/phage-associated family protein
MKNPAVLWYPSDFTSSTVLWNNEQCGAYIRLLNYQFILGHLTKEQLYQITTDQIVLSKFIQDSEGFYYNERMDLEIKKRQKYSESRSQNKLGKTKTYDNHIKNISKSYDNHMGNENENINENNKDIFTFIEEQFGRILYPAEIELISTWEDNELTRYAIKETVLNNVNNLKYTQAILNSYKAKNITTIAQAQKESKKIKADVPSWLNEERKEKELTDEQKRILKELKASD